MVYLCSNFTSNISYPLASDFPKFIQAAISSNMFIFFPFRLCEFQWRSRDNDRRMRLAGQLLRQLLKLACLLLLLMVRRMFIQTISIQRISVDIWLECSFFCLFGCRIWTCPAEDVCSSYRLLHPCSSRLQPHDRGGTDCICSADVHAGSRSRLNFISFVYDDIFDECIKMQIQLL